MQGNDVCSQLGENSLRAGKEPAGEALTGAGHELSQSQTSF